MTGYRDVLQWLGLRGDYHLANEVVLLLDEKILLRDCLSQELVF